MLVGLPFDAPLRVLDLVEHYHATADALEEFGRLLCTLKSSAIGGKYGCRSPRSRERRRGRFEMQPAEQRRSSSSSWSSFVLGRSLGGWSECPANSVARWQSNLREILEQNYPSLTRGRFRKMKPFESKRGGYRTMERRPHTGLEPTGFLHALSAWTKPLRPKIENFFQNIDLERFFQ